MGRPEKLLDPVGGPAQEFADHLRTLRRRGGLPTYAALARRSGIGASTLCAAAGGARLPRLDVAVAYARACGSDPRETRDRWTRARSALDGAGALPGEVDPTRIESPEELAGAMRRLLAGRGLSLRTLARADAGPRRSLSRSSVSDLLRGVRLPTPEVLDGFLRCCGQPGPVRAQWLAALDRIGRPAPPRARTADPGQRALADELGMLRRGRGLQAGDLAERVGPTLRGALGLAPDAEQAVVRRLLVDVLTRKVASLPADLRLPVQVALALHPECRFSFEHERIRWVADRIDRHPRTVRRRVRHGLGLLAGRLTGGALDGGDEVWIR